MKVKSGILAFMADACLHALVLAISPPRLSPQRPHALQSYKARFMIFLIIYPIILCKFDGEELHAPIKHWGFN